ncbi:hypothetical protein ACFLRO_00980 [Bacteroidota bacterium]
MINTASKAELKSFIYQAVREVIYEVLEEDPRLRVSRSGAWLSMSDLCRMTGFGKPTISKWHKLGLLRLSKPAGGRELRTTPQMWEEDARRLIAMGIIGELPLSLKEILSRVSK